jgi:hypothetical protein
VHEHVQQLTRDGVTIVEGVYNPSQLKAFRQAVGAAWAKIQPSLPTLTWEPIRYRPEFVAKQTSFAVGKALYEGRRSASHEGTEVIDMGRGRFDLYGGLLRGGALESAPGALFLTAIADAVLGPGLWTGEHVCPGVLPTVLPDGNSSSGHLGGRPHGRDDASTGGVCSWLFAESLLCPGCAVSHAISAIMCGCAGLWHRDAYPLFESEELDLSLPPYYLTVLAPLADLAPGEGGTEFVRACSDALLVGGLISRSGSCRSAYDLPSRRVSGK